MNKTLSLTLHSFREALHSRVLFLGGVHLAVMLLCFLFLGAADAVDKIKVMESVAFITMSFFGSLLALLLPVISLHEEIETKKLYTVLTKPVNRFTFLVTKVTGILLFILVFTCILALISLVFIGMAGWDVEGELAAHRFRKAETCARVRLDGSQAPLEKTETFTRGSEFASVQWRFEGITEKDLVNDRVKTRLNLTAYGVGVVFSIDFSKVYLVAVNPDTGARVQVASGLDAIPEPAVIVPKRGFVDVYIPREGLSSDGATIIEVFRPGTKYKLFPEFESVLIYLRSGSYMVNYGKVVLLMYFKFIFIAAVAVCGAAFFSLSSGVTFGLFVILTSYLLAFIRENAAPSEEAFYGILFFLFRFLAPDFDMFNRVNRLIDRLYISWTYLAVTAVLAVGIYSMVYLAIGYFGLKDREL